jgi:hypothetical protein
MKRRNGRARWWASTALAGVVFALVVSAGFAQERVGGERVGGKRLTPSVNKSTPQNQGGYGRALGDGYQLDGSLQLGSGGYNRPRGAGRRAFMPTSRYMPGSTQSLYTIDRSGEFVYNTHNAFNPRSNYTSVGYRGNYTSPASFRQFRRSGQY